MLTPLAAHGAVYTVLSDRVLKIETRFDTGEPISHAEVLVFPPEISTSVYVLETDSEGIFHFFPDREGTWVLQVRGHEGHGLRINLPVDASMTADLSQSGGFSTTQKIIMSLCVLWGAVGTALYFRRGR